MKTVKEIATDLEIKIKTGLYKEFIPKTITLEKIYNVSRIKIRNVIWFLKGRGIIEGSQGKRARIINNWKGK